MFSRRKIKWLTLLPPISASLVVAARMLAPRKRFLRVRPTRSMPISASIAVLAQAPAPAKLSPRPNGETLLLQPSPRRIYPATEAVGAHARDASEMILGRSHFLYLV